VRARSCLRCVDDRKQRSDAAIDAEFDALLADTAALSEPVPSGMVRVCTRDHAHALRV
jgi:hypothetical protein